MVARQSTINARAAKVQYLPAPKTTLIRVITVWETEALDASIIASAIEAGGMILAAAITAGALYFVGDKFVNQERLKEDLRTAVMDIDFLLCVESIHCENHNSKLGKSNKITVRKSASDQGKTWSGKFTPGRVDHDKTKPRSFLS